MKYSLNDLYKVIGLTKQAVHQYQKRERIFEQNLSYLVLDVQDLREDHPGCGLEKIYYTLQPDFIGRDRFVDLFLRLGYGVKKRKNYIKTTIPSCYQYDNLIQGLLVTRINQVVQSDITYYNLGGSFYYLIFLIDVFSKRIVGHQVSDHMRAQANVRALKQLIKLRGPKAMKGMIHHSDRGSQYGAKIYTNLLKDLGCYISMGQKAQDNAYAERVNGIIKNEYLNYWKIETKQQLSRMVKKAVDHYNSNRIHRHLPERLTPINFEQRFKNNSKENSHFELIFAEQNALERSSFKHLNDYLEGQIEYSCPLF